MTNFVKDQALRSLIIILLLIFTDILCENYIVILYNGQSHFRELFFLLSYMIFQIVFAPLQSGFSDFIGRRKSILSSLGITFLSLVLTLIFIKSAAFSFALIFSLTAIKGIAGNTIPLSLAAIADTQGKNYRISFALSSSTYAVSYLILGPFFSSLTYKTANFSLLGLVLVLIMIVLFGFKDREDSTINLQLATKELHPENAERSFLQILFHEPILIKQDLSQKDTLQALAAFFLWEVSMYSILVSQVDFRIYKSIHFVFFMMLGYLAGITVLFFLKKIDDSKIIKYGYIISTLSLPLYFLLFRFIKDISPVLKICYFFHAFGNAFLSPALMSILAKEKPPHEQGKRYGLVDSVDTIAFLVATLFALYISALKLSLSYLIIFSYLSFLISWRFYARFKKISE